MRNEIVRVRTNRPASEGERAALVRAAICGIFLLLLGACGGHDGSTSGPGRPAGIYVGTLNNSVLVFAPDAQGNAAPIRKISGPHTGLSLPIGLGVDASNNLYVANRTGAGVTVYPVLADGDVTPTRTLTATGMASAEGLVVGPANDVFVSNCPGCGSSGGGAVSVFHFANAATQSDYSLTGNNTGFSVPSCLALDENRNLFVANSFGGNVALFPPGSSGNNLPIRSFTPSPNGNIQSMVYGSNTIFVTIPGTGIYLYPATATGATAVSAATITASATLPLQYPGGMAVDTSVTPPVIYLADFIGNALYVIHTAGLAPNLTVASVTTIKGPATGLDSPLGVLVVSNSLMH